jgi:transcriptional regulator with XRE-family HTH domain
MPDAEIGALVKRLRKRMRLTQEQFAREVGVSFSTVNQWENGRRRPQPYLMNRLRELDAAGGGKVAESHRGEARRERRSRSR